MCSFHPIGSFSHLSEFALWNKASLPEELGETSAKVVRHNFRSVNGPVKGAIYNKTEINYANLNRGRKSQIDLAVNCFWLFGSYLTSRKESNDGIKLRFMITFQFSVENWNIFFLVINVWWHFRFLTTCPYRWLTPAVFFTSTCYRMLNFQLVIQFDNFARVTPVTSNTVAPHIFTNRNIAIWHR